MTKLFLIITLFVTIAVLVTGCAASAPSPQDFAQAAIMQQYASYQLDSQLAARLEAARQAGYLQAKQERDNIGWILFALMIILVPTIISVTAIVIVLLRKRQSEMMAGVAQIPMRQVFSITYLDNGQYLLTDQTGRARLLDWQSPRDVRLLQEVGAK